MEISSPASMSRAAPTVTVNESGRKRAKALCQVSDEKLRE
jgi:hypothetical protein